MVVSRKRNPFDLKVYFDNTEINVTNELKILGVTFDSKLTWKKHLGNVSGRAGQKLGALCRVSSKLSTQGVPQFTNLRLEASWRFRRLPG